jgi:uncharacterized protein YuzE
MKLEFDPIADAAYLEIQAGDVVTSREIEAGIVADFDEQGRIVGIEILHVSKRSTTPVPLKDAA